VRGAARHRSGESVRIHAGVLWGHGAARQPEQLRQQQAGLAARRVDAGLGEGRGGVIESDVIGCLGQPGRS
jgi:hypothetical protein